MVTKSKTVRKPARKTVKAKLALVPMVVTTEKKGVFFGYAPKPTGKVPSDLRLVNARMCVYWSSDVKGVLGLAAIGPTRSCKVGLSVPALHLNEITSISECTPEAVAAWEKGPWN